MNEVPALKYLTKSNRRSCTNIPEQAPGLIEYRVSRT